MISINKIYTILANALNEGDLETYCTREHSINAPSFPCMYFRETHYRPRESVDFANSDVIVNSTVYVELYAKKNIYDLVEIVEATMRSMDYIEDSCIEVDNADVSIDRYSLTFSRIICEGDSINEMP